MPVCQIRPLLPLSSSATGSRVYRCGATLCYPRKGHVSDEISVITAGNVASQAAGHPFCTGNCVSYRVYGGKIATAHGWVSYQHAEWRVLPHVWG